MFCCPAAVVRYVSWDCAALPRSSLCRDTELQRLNGHLCFTRRVTSESAPNVVQHSLGFKHAIHLYSTRSSILPSSDLLLDDLRTHDILLSSVLSIGLGSTHPSPGQHHGRRQVRQRREEGSGSNPCVLLQYHANCQFSIR